MRAIFLFLVTMLVLGVSVTHAQIAPYPVVLTMAGPSAAVSRQEVTYRVHYRLTDPAALPQAGFSVGFNIRIPLNTTYVSTGVVSGPPGVLHDRTERFVVWGVTGNAEETEGDVELTVKIDAEYVGSIFADAYVPGTETTGSNVVETQVFAPGTLPETGSGAQQGACGRPREPGELAILGRTSPPVDQGTVRIPELALTSAIVGGCFEFRNLTLPQDPMLVSFEIQVEGYRPTTWANYVVLGTGLAPIFTPRLEPGDIPEPIDPCPDLLSTPQEDLSAAGYQQAQLCAQLPSASTLPETGSGTGSGGSGLSWLVAALSGFGALAAALGLRQAARRR